MAILDKGFREHKLRYVLQCGLATVSVLVVLLILYGMSNAAVIAALGASSFIAFTMPQAQVSRPRFLIGGYVVGAAAGTLCHYLNAGIPWQTDVIFGALAVGLAIFGMVITDTEHPPAAGLALGLVLGECNYLVLLVVLLGIASLCLIKLLLGPALKNLL